MQHRRTGLYINLGFLELAEKYAALPCDGVGLMRSEFMALSMATHPGHLIEQGGAEKFIDTIAGGLRTVAEAFHPRPVTFRTLDLKSNEYADLDGGDKYEAKEENPMIGFRGCARYLADPESFRLELRAVKRVRDAGLRNVRLMLPFVRFPSELTRCREIMEEEGLFSDSDFELWMMAELPANVFRIEEFLPHVSGVSIGSNDLTQLLLGIDRDSDRLASVFDERDPTVARAIAMIASACRDAGKPVSICGNAPSQYPEMIEALIAAGVSGLSVTPEAFETARQAVEAAEKKLGLTNG